MLISRCNVKSWEIAITSGDSSNIHDCLDGSVVFVTTPPPLHRPSSAASSLSLPRADVPGSVCPSHLWVLSAIASVTGFHRWNQMEGA